MSHICFFVHVYSGNELIVVLYFYLFIDTDCNKVTPYLSVLQKRIISFLIQVYSGSRLVNNHMQFPYLQMEDEIP